MFEVVGAQRFSDLLIPGATMITQIWNRRFPLSESIEKKR